MTEKVELFYKTLSFTPLWGLLDLLLVIHFFCSWYRSKQKTGWKIDFWYANLFFIFFPSVFLLYPFNGSIYNNVATMGMQPWIAPFIDKAFLISVLGYLSVWMGRFLFDATRGKFPLIAFFQLTWPVCGWVEKNIKNRRAYLSLVYACILLGSLILVIQFQAGYFFNARGLFLKQPYLRPLFNVTISLFPIAMAYLSLRYIQFKEKTNLSLLFVLLLLSIFFGVRALALSGLLFMCLHRIYHRHGQCSFLKLGALCCTLAFLAVLLGQFREGHFDLYRVFPLLLAKILYGNNFSDTRDFAWILSYWDGHYLYGRTYIAAFLSFIPRVFSSIRERWGISMITNSLIGFDSNEMPGLRPGVFGESFLNFSYPGVILFGLLFGFALRYSDVKIKEYVTKSKDIIKGYSHVFLFSLLCTLSVTAGMWAFYVFLLINFFIMLVRNSFPRKPLNTPRQLFPM
jgi:hypothetical protein